jgi:hypothetical protein
VDDRRGKGVGRSLVNSDPVCRRIGLRKNVGEHPQSFGIAQRFVFVGHDADDTDLPQEERARRVEFSLVNQEVRGFEHLTTFSWIDSEVGKQTNGRADSRQHDGAETVAPRAPDGLVERIRKNTWMTVRHGAHIELRAHGRQQPRDDLFIDLEPVSTNDVTVAKRLSRRIGFPKPEFGEGISEQVEQLSSPLDARQRFRSDLARDLKSRANGCQRSLFCSRAPHAYFFFLAGFFAFFFFFGVCSVLLADAR